MYVVILFLGMIFGSLSFISMQLGRILAELRRR